jgi:plasmid stabilization system protein ParE
MKIVLSQKFRNKLENQIEYIALDKPFAARRFRNTLFEKIKDIPNNPYRFRKSIYFQEECIRDLIWQGYTIVFEIRSTEIEVFGLINREEKL